MQLAGISTGIDTASLIAQLMNVSKQRLYTYKVQQNKYEERNTALGELRGKLNAFNGSLSSLTNYDSLFGFKATSTDTDILSATAASTGVFEGTHDIEVNQLANAERVVHSGFLFAESLVNPDPDDPQNFIYSYNHQEVVISTEGTTTLADLAGLINNDADNPGITATILEYDNGDDGVFHLMLSGNNAGTDYQISINSSTTQVLAANIKLEASSEDASLTTKIIDLDQFSGVLRGDEKITIDDDGQPGSTAIDMKDFDLTADMNVGHLIDRINDAFDGIARAKFEDGRITLTDDVSGGTSTTMVLALTGGGGTEPAALILPTFSTTVADGGTVGNELTIDNVWLDPADFTKTQIAQDSQIRINGASFEIQTLSPATLPATGTYTLTYDGETTGNIAVGASETDIQDALELLTNVNAGDIKVSGSLDAGDVKFKFASSLSDVSMISIDPALLNVSGASNYTIEETASAWMSSSSNSVSAMGITMELYDVGTVQVSLNKDTASLKNKLKALVSSYNAAIKYIKEKSSYDPETNTAGVLMSSYTTRTIKTLMRAGIRAQAAGFTEGEEEYIYAYEIGLDYSSEKETLGMLVLDETKLDEAIENNFEAVAALIGIANVGRSSGTDKDIITFNDSSRFTQAGEYEIEVVTDGDNAIQQVKVKHSSESEWHYQPSSSWTPEGIVTIEGKENDDGDWYPERDLQLSIDIAALGSSQTYSATIHVKQGFAGTLKERLNDVLDTTTTTIHGESVPNGYLAIDVISGDKAVEALDGRIEREEKRLQIKEDRLTAKFARLEKTMTLLQQQFSALSMLQAS